MTESLPLILREEPFFDALEIELPEGVAVVTMEFPEVTSTVSPRSSTATSTSSPQRGPSVPDSRSTTAT